MEKHDLCVIRIAMTWQNKHVACVAPHSRLSAQEVLKSNTLALQHHEQAHDLKVRHCVVGSFVESGWFLFWRDRCLDCCRAVMVCLCVPVPSFSPTGRSRLSCGVL